MMEQSSHKHRRNTTIVSEKLEQVLISPSITKKVMEEIHQTAIEYLANLNLNKRKPPLITQPSPS